MPVNIPSELKSLGDEHHTNKFSQHRYHTWYERHLGPLRGREFSLLEIGVMKGASLRVWRDYFPRARIYGIDINPNASKMAPAGTRVFIGEQTDPKFLGAVLKQTGPLDVVIDDGGHKMAQQVGSFQYVFPRMRSGGIYSIEDLFTSYRPKWGGGPIGKAGTALSYLKGLVDEVHREEHKTPVGPSEIRELCFYHFIAFIVRK